jgi:hypothetical protein
MDDPPEIPEPEFSPPFRGDNPESSVRPGIHVSEPVAIDPTDVNLPAPLDFAMARELVAKARHVRHLTLRNSLDPAWREIRERVVDLRAAILHNVDDESKHLVQEINHLLNIH